MRIGRPRSFDITLSDTERTQPILPLGLGYVEGITKASRMTTSVMARRHCSPPSISRVARSSHNVNIGIAIKSSLVFSKHINASVPARFDVHLVLDNYATHKHAKVMAWLARRPRFHALFTPTYAFWLNQVERSFGLITQRAIHPGSFRTVRELIHRIETFITHYNSAPSPFTWTATTDSILPKVERLTKAINGTSH